MATATNLTPTEVIDRVRAARKAEQRAAVEQLELALEWARLHPCPGNETPAHWGEADLHDEGLVPLAGVGAPWVAEFAPVDLAAALGITQDAGRQLVADALELAYRLPKLWARVLAGEVPVWRARLIARETTDLSVKAALFADRLIAATPRRIGQVKAAQLVQEARLYFDPDRALADEEEALTTRGVWLRHGGAPATTDVTMTLDTPDALLFDQTVTRIASDLRELDDTEDLDARRARAVGILADPQHALDLLSGREAAPSPGARAGAANLYVHLTRADLAGDLNGMTGAASVEKLGAATTKLLTDWLHRFAAAGTKITLRPVLDLASTQAVDQHDPPDAMRETVVLRDAHCVFPGCGRDSRRCDLDHITEYLPMEDGGPPGQTSPGNLAPLCRAHHRVKTHSAWHYKRLDGGSYAWTAPTGHQYTVAPASRRTDLGLA
jgi:hypothetical protein